MKDKKVVDLKHYLNKKIEPRKLQVNLDFLEDRGKNLHKRSFAFALDIFTIGVLKVGTVFSYAKFLETMVVDLTFSQKYQLQKALTYFDFFLTFAIFFGYFTFCFYTLNGKTLGKKLMKLTVITNNYMNNPDEHDFKMTFGQAFMRTLGYLVSYLSFGIMFALPFLRSDQKSLSEIFSKTTVLTDIEFYKHFILRNKTQEVIKVDIEEQTDEKQAA